MVDSLDFMGEGTRERVVNTSSKKRQVACRRFDTRKFDDFEPRLNVTISYLRI